MRINLLHPEYQMCRSGAHCKMLKSAADGKHKAHHFMRRLLCSSPAHERTVCEDTQAHVPHQQARCGHTLIMTRAEIDLRDFLACVKLHRAPLRDAGVLD